MSYHIEGAELVTLAIAVLYLGNWLNRKVRFLGDNNIPAAVTGGLACSVAVTAVAAMLDADVTFATRGRDLLILLFFSTVGLGAKFRNLAAGGSALALLLVVATVFLVVQDATGVALAWMMDVHPGYGLLGGSVSFAGGHGTAIAWGAQAEQAGLDGAKEIGLACATFGLIAGGLVGGPLAGRLIERHGLTPSEPTSPPESATVTDQQRGEGGLDAILATILLLALCVQLGDVVNRWLFSNDVVVPGFLTAMLVGIVITNGADLAGKTVDTQVLDGFGEISLRLFLAISLMSMNLTALASGAGPLLIVLLLQVTVITVFAVAVVFRVMGSDYDAAVMAAGFTGLGLGATPVAIGNMHAVTRRYGPSTKAFLVVPLVGAFFIDIANAVVIKGFIAMF